MAEQFCGPPKMMFETMCMNKVHDEIDSPASSMPRNLFGFEVVDFIGEGAGSVIYAVTKPESGQLYALKHVIRRTEKDVRFIEQVENEFEVSQKFAHPGLRRSIDVKVTRTLLRKPIEAILVMELFDGVPLDAQNTRNVNKTIGLFIQVAEALHALHALGLVHCDLKPNNILINSRNKAKVIDFGQTCPTGTAKSRIQGTPDFISPEQVKCEPVDARTDVFNFGATLYWALTGQSLPTLFNIRKSQNSFLFDSAIPTPASLNPTVSEPLSNLVMDCVKTNPAKRPADMEDVGRRLEIIHFSMNRPAATAAELADSVA